MAAMDHYPEPFGSDDDDDDESWLTGMDCTVFEEGEKRKPSCARPDRGCFLSFPSFTPSFLPFFLDAPPQGGAHGVVLDLKAGATAPPLFGLRHFQAGQRAEEEQILFRTEDS
jgi:hypothetical protein